MDFSHELYAAFADELANIASSDKEASHTSRALDFARSHSGVVNHGLASSVAAKMHPAAYMIEDPEGMKMILRHHADKATSDHLKAFNKKAGAGYLAARRRRNMGKEAGFSPNKVMGALAKRRAAIVGNPMLAEKTVSQVQGMKPFLRELPGVSPNSTRGALMNDHVRALTDVGPTASGQYGLWGR